MTKSSTTKITLVSENELFQEAYYRRLWIATSARSSSIPRRIWLDELADTFRDFDGQFFTVYGDEYELPDLDDVFGNDTDMRWFSEYLKVDDSGDHPKIKSRKYERLQLIDLYFKIRFPDIAQHFGR